MGRPEGLARPPLVSTMELSLLALCLFVSTGVSSLPQPVPRVSLSFDGKTKKITKMFLREGDDSEQFKY